MADEFPPRNLFAVWNWPRPMLVVAGMLLLLAVFASLLFSFVAFFGVSYTVQSSPAPASIAVPVDAGSTTGP
jgi:hypothetical protein